MIDVIKEAIRGYFIGMLLITIMSAAFAAPILVAWNEGPHAMGAPMVSYLPVACTLALFGCVYMALYLGAGVVRSVVKSTLGDL